MRRPQSANHNRNYFAQPSREEDETQQSPHRVFLKAGGKKAMFNPMTASNDLTRLLPKKIQHDKERLYCETLQLKTNLNEVSEENLRLKTKIATLQREKDRLNRTEQPPLPKGKSANFSNLNCKGEKENGMVSGLKKMIRQVKQENELLKGEISRLKRAVRYTKINELQTEKQTVYEENRRLGKVMQQLEGELSSRVRQDEQLKQLQGELEERTLQLKEVTADNMKYEEILEDMEMKNKEVTERLLVTERKWQRDISVEKRKIQQLNRQVDLLKHEVKMLAEKLEEEKKKGVPPANKKPSRPVSSRPYQDLQSNKNKLKEKEKEKEQAILKNKKLKEELEQAKKKLAQSQNQLKVAAPDPTATAKDKLGASKDQTFELILTKNQASQFMKHDEDSYNPDFDQSPKPSNNFNQLPLQEKSKTKIRQPINTKHLSPVLQQIRQILTYRMKYTRYPFHELKADIESSPLRSFNYEDLINMLESQPFFLTSEYAHEFLKACFGKSRMTSEDQLDSKVLLRNLRTVIGDFQLLDEKEEEQMLYQIAQLMTKHRSQLQQAFKRVADGQNCITKTQLTSVLRKHGEMSDEEINLAICYISINAQTLQAISYTDLLDRFYINSSKEFSNSKGRPRNNPADQLFSMGENEDLDEGELIADDELV